jgi:apolipoprotein N-acyltransferase
MRAIEQGIPLARVAGTGITAFVDPFGRVVKKINLNQEGIIDVDLIKNLAPTIYANYGYKPLILLLAVILIFLITTRKIYANRQNHTH